MSRSTLHTHACNWSPLIHTQACQHMSKTPLSHKKTQYMRSDQEVTEFHSFLQYHTTHLNRTSLSMSGHIPECPQSHLTAAIQSDMIIANKQILQPMKNLLLVSSFTAFNRTEYRRMGTTVTHALQLFSIFCAAL